VSGISVPLNRWGRIAEPEDSAGAFLLVDPEKPDGWKVPPPEDAIRIWRRRPGAADDDDLENWTVWLHESELEDWLADYRVSEWLPEGVEPPWDRT
jgi:hypothetical protein